VGSAGLAIIPMGFGIPGYLAPIVIITLCYTLFQTANNTAVMRDVAPDQRGVISGLLNLARSLGLITGASLMGAIYALASGSSELTATQPGSAAFGLRVTFAVSVALIIGALAIAGGSRILVLRQTQKHAALSAIS
jgi:hypothetical protein